MDTPASVNTSLISGFANYTLPEHILFSSWKETVAKVYDQYGFVRFESRKVERASDLTRKGGDDREIYAITRYKGGEMMDDNLTPESTLCLPFDRTVPMAKFFADKPKTVLPLKRLDVEYSWRAESVQLGRFCAFVQADVDVVDRSLNILAEAECIKAIVHALNEIGISKFIMYFNHIGIAKGLIDTLHFEEEDARAALRIIDKLDKITPQQAIDELVNIDEKTSLNEITALVDMFKFRGNIADFKIQFENDVRVSDEIRRFINEVSSLMELLALEGVDSNLIEFCPGMVRGLEYYTGIVFETFLTEAPLRGSIASGGRYDNLVDAVSTNSTASNIKGFGGSIGLTRLFALCRDLGMVNPVKLTAAKVLIGYRNIQDEKDTISKLQLKAAGLANRVRKQGITADLYTNSETPFKKELKYANTRGFDNAIFVMDEDKILVKDMLNATQREVSTVASAVDVLVQFIVMQNSQKRLDRYEQAHNPSGKVLQAPKEPKKVKSVEQKTQVQKSVRPHRAPTPEEILLQDQKRAERMAKKQAK